jgi:hypothetical protein
MSFETIEEKSKKITYKLNKENHLKSNKSIKKHFLSEYSTNSNRIKNIRGN